MPTTDLPTTVQLVRKHYSAARTMERNIRLRRYNGRNSRSTEREIDYHYRRASRLAAAQSQRLHGLLWEEHQLALRISENRDQGNDRPELRERLRVLRNAIRTEVSAASNRSQVIA